MNTKKSISSPTSGGFIARIAFYEPLSDGIQECIPVSTDVHEAVSDAVMEKALDLLSKDQAESKLVGEISFEDGTVRGPWFENSELPEELLNALPEGRTVQVYDIHWKE